MTGHGVRRAYLIDHVLVDGRSVARVREVIPGAGKKDVRADSRVHPRRGSFPGWTPRRRLRTGVLVALVVVVLGLLVAVGWAVYLLAVWVIAHTLTIGALVALVVLVLAGTGTTCTVIHVRR